MLLLNLLAFLVGEEEEGGPELTVWLIAVTCVLQSPFRRIRIFLLAFLLLSIVSAIGSQFGMIALGILLAQFVEPLLLLIGHGLK